MKKTKILTLVAMAALLAACGGTSSSVTSSSQGGSTPSTSQTPSVSSETSTATSSQGGSSSTTSQTPVEEEYRVNIGSTMGGITVTSDKEKAKAGEVITLTVTVTNNSYTVTGVFYDESACTKTNDTTYWFIMPDHPVTVTVRANVEGDVTLQGDITAALTEENGIYVARNVRVDADSDFNLVIKSGDTTEELNSFSLDRYKTTANIEYSRQNEYAFEIKGGCTYDFFYDVNNGARPFYVRRTAVNSLPSGEDSLYSLFAGSILSEYTVNPQGITAINYTNEAANETYQWKLYNNNTSYAKVTESDSTGAVKTKAEVYTKLEDSTLTIVDTYTPSTEDAYEYDYSCWGDSEKYAGRYVVSDNDEDGDLTNDIEFEQYSNYVNSHTADFVLKQGYNHGMESIETDFMHSYRVGMTVEDYIKQASVNITSEDTAEGFTTKIVSSKTYDDTGTNGGVGKYHLEYRATLNFKDDGTLLSVDYEYKTFDESVFNFTNFTWLSGDTASNYTNNGKLVNHVTATYTYGTESAPDYTFDVTPYFVSQIKDLSVNNPDADIDAANKLNVGDAAEDYATCTYLPETALDTWQYEFLSSSNENVIAYDDSYVEYAAIGDGTTTLTFGSVNGLGTSATVDVTVAYTYKLRNIYLYEDFGKYAPTTSSSSAELNAGTVAEYGLQAKESAHNTVIPLPSDATAEIIDKKGLDIAVTLNNVKGTLVVDTSKAVVTSSTDFVVRINTSYYDSEWVSKPIEFTFTILPGVSVDGIVGTYLPNDSSYAGDSITFTKNSTSSIPGYEGTLPYIGTMTAAKASYSFAWGINELGEIETEFLSGALPEGAMVNLDLVYHSDTESLDVIFSYSVIGDTSGGDFGTTYEVIGYYDEENFPVYVTFNKQ